MPKSRRSGFKKRQRLWRDRASARQGHLCCYCRRYVPEGERTAEHFPPVSRGGVNCEKHVFMACRSCNQRAAEALNPPPQHDRHIKAWRRYHKWLAKNLGERPAYRRQPGAEAGARSSG